MSDKVTKTQGFTYQLCLDIDTGKKHRTKVASTFFRDTKMYLSGDVFVFERCHTRIASIDKGDVITLLNVNEWCENLTSQNRVGTILNLGESSWANRQTICSDRARHKHCEQPVRLWQGRRWNGDEGDATLPVTEGMQFKHGSLLNPEIAVDKKLRTDREATKIVSAKLAPLSKLMKTMARIGVLLPVVDEYMTTNNRPPRTQVDDIPFEEPTVALVESLLLDEFAGRGGNWYWKNYSEDQRNQQIKAKVETTLKRIRKSLYADMNAVNFVEVGDGKDHRKAA
jgi:hypothetical protein